MSKGIVAVSLMGRMGNQIFQWAYAKAYAERHGFEFQCDPWIGQRVFGIKDTPIADASSLKRVDEYTLVDGESDVIFRTYAQNDRCMIYTKQDCLRWFKFSDEVVEHCKGLEVDDIAAHFRRGDYVGYGYPLPSKKSYEDACARYFPEYVINWVSEENPSKVYAFDDSMKDIPDFYILATAPILFRANSSFSWWAGTLNPNKEVYSPVMTNGLLGGHEHHVEWVRGNHPAFRGDLPFLTDLHLKDE